VKEPITTQAGLVRAMRRLREAAGHQSLRTICTAPQARGRIDRSTLHLVLAGRPTPGPGLLEAFADVCDAGPAATAALLAAPDRILNGPPPRPQPLSVCELIEEAEDRRERNAAAPCTGASGRNATGTTSSCTTRPTPARPHRDPRPPHSRTLPRRLPHTPADRCEPIPGQPYDQIPTERTGVTPARRIEEPVYFSTEASPARIVHRGDCHAVRDVSHPATTTQARTALTRNDTEPCDICRPDRPLRPAAA
jgi:hypothetical protein